MHEITPRTERLAESAVRSILEISYPRGVKTLEKPFKNFVYVAGRPTLEPFLQGPTWNAVLVELMRLELNLQTD